MRSLLIKPTMRPRSVSSILVNLKPIPRPVCVCLTTASALIVPSGTKKCTCAAAPKGLGLAHSTNRPVGLMFRTTETISRSLQRQMTQTPSGVSMRDSERLEGQVTSFNIRHLPEQSFGDEPNALRIFQAKLVKKGLLERPAINGFGQ